MIATHKFRDFASGIIEKDPQRILNIFYLLKTNHTNCVFWYSNIIYQSKVIQIKGYEVRLFIADFEPTSQRSVDIYFEVLNQYYHCEVNITRFAKEQVFIRLPQELSYLADRKFPRVNFDDLFIRFNTLYSRIFTAQGTLVDPRNYPYFVEEITKDFPSLKQIYRVLLDHIKKIGDDFSIVMLHKKDPESYSIYEKTLLKTKKTVLIEDVTKTGSYIEEINSPDLVNLSKYYELRENEVGELKASREIEALKKADSKKFLVSYLMTPIHIYNHIVGYIRIETNQFQKYRIHRLLAEELHIVCEVFSYGLTKIKIGGFYFKEDATKSRVLNLSANGMLLEIFDEVLFEYLKKFKRIKILVTILSRNLELKAEIVRFFKRGGAYYLGMNIFQGGPGDIKQLKEYINENLKYDFF